MQTIIILLVMTQLVIAAAAVLGPKMKIPGPLILVMAGIGVSALPFVPDVVINPHIIVLGLLPPLLYASATAVPAMNLRREFTAVNLLSIVLVVVSALVLGALFAWMIPGLGLGWGVALGATLSPTDAVATTIIKGRGVPERVSAMLEGEGLLNDASALIVLRTAIIATSLGFSFWPTVGSFIYAIMVAVLIGRLAARINLAMRRRIHEEAVNTVLSFTTPFIAAIPAELLHASGLVAAVVAGFFIGTQAPRELPPGHRVSDSRNWATLEISLEGVIFLTMGLQLATIIRQVRMESSGLERGLLIALIAFVLTVAVRAVFVTPLLWFSHRRSLREQARQPQIMAMQQELEAGRVPDAIAHRARRWKLPLGERMLGRITRRVRRHLADLDHFSRQPLDRASTVVVIWAGMRGAVTVAAVQLLPDATPHRPLLVFIAFAVAALSLLIQGGSVGMLVAWLFPRGESEAARLVREAERTRIRQLLEQVVAKVERKEDMTAKTYRLAVLSAKRNALLDLRDDGLFSSEELMVAMRDVDIDEMVLELRSEAVENRHSPSVES
ncbi:cation:proton antiporter [Dyella sp.]|uniref:cation:proton antiporter n=1 Tax=Dyella sp. TaxID=1869338 RepID=UPI002ED0ADE0